MDIALIVDKLVPNAQYTQSKATKSGETDYDVLKRTWTDARRIPTEQEIIDAESGVLADQVLRDDIPTLEEIAEVLLAEVPASPAVDALKARLAAGKGVGGKL